MTTEQVARINAWEVAQRQFDHAVRFVPDLRDGLIDFLAHLLGRSLNRSSSR